MNGKLAKGKRGSGGPKCVERAKRRNALDATAELNVAKKVKPRHHTRAKGHGPTWPDTPDQRAQSRPVTVLHPVRAIVRAKLIPAHMAKALGKEARQDVNNFLLEGVTINV